MRLLIAAFASLTLLPSGLAAAQSASDDGYTRYELLAPPTSSFRIVYDVSATTGGARFYFNPIRPGSEASEESVLDRMTGQSLRFEVVSGEQARRDGQAGATAEGEYLKVHLARPVPEGGETRLRIIKTYRDAASYHQDGNEIVFERSLGIKRNAVVLPAGYEVVSCNFPSQVMEESDGRILVSHLNNTPSAAPLVIRARRFAVRSPRPSATEPGVGGPFVVAPPSPPAPPGIVRAPAARTQTPGADPLQNLRVSERALQDREIVYFLHQPETHTFSLYHDYTESRPGTRNYLNVVREGSTVSDPSALILDTGEVLRVETLKGAAVTEANLGVRGVTPETEVVVIHFDPIVAGQSVRLRISETYTDESRYGLVDGELAWHRSFGRPANDLVLPEGWYLTASSIPAVITTEDDGRIRLSFVNPRPDSVDVIVKAKRR